MFLVQRLYDAQSGAVQGLSEPNSFALRMLVCNSNRLLVTCYIVAMRGVSASFGEWRQIITINYWDSL